MIRKSSFTLVLCCLALTACKFQPFVDPTASEKQKELFKQDVQRVLDYKFKPKKSPWFQKIFRGNDSQSVIDMVSERIHYVFPYYPASDLNENTLASNIGTNYYLMNLASQPLSYNLEIDKMIVPISSTRSGIILLGKAYDQETPGKSQTPALLRMSTLVHEARHSDCPSLPTAKDLANFIQGNDMEDSQCGYIHSFCPSGHNLFGMPACDSSTWGAYSIEGVLLKHIYNNCTNCSEEERQLALVLAAERFERVLNIDDLLSGKLGEPDLSSVNYDPEKIMIELSEFSKNRIKYLGNPQAGPLNSSELNPVQLPTAQPNSSATSPPESPTPSPWGEESPLDSQLPDWSF